MRQLKLRQLYAITQRSRWSIFQSCTTKTRKQWLSITTAGHCVTMTCSAELYEQIVEHCRREDLPVAVFCRSVIKQAVERKTQIL